MQFVYNKITNFKLSAEITENTLAHNQSNALVKPQLLNFTLDSSFSTEIIVGVFQHGNNVHVMTSAN